MIKLLIFDFDGTIADTATDICNAVNEFLSLYNKPNMTLEQLRPHIGLGLRQLIEDIFSELEGSFLDHENMYKDFIACYKKNFLINIQCYPGFHKFLDQWDQDIAIVSNKWEQFLIPSLEKLDLQNYNWRHVIGRDTLAEHKPHPLPLLTCLRTSNVGPHEALMIGDGLPDIRAAKAANIQSVAVEFGYAPIDALKREGADQTLRHFEDLYGLIQKINSL